MANNQSVRVRFAPSPTGNPHVGNFRTALYNFLFARHNNGAFLLRYEDTDRARSKQAYVDAIEQSMRWMGMQWDEEPVFQSQRIERHREVALQLLEQGKAYRCRMTSEELEALRQQQTEAGQKPMYNGRDRDKNYPDDGTPFAVRLKTPQSGVTQIHDRVRGEVVVQNEEIEDFVLLRTDGSPTYNFAVVVDDLDMQISHVIRGDDHLSNSIRQSLVYQLLEEPLPVFVHLPQILGEDRTRLSKRHGATGVLEYRAQGYLAEALVNYLARLGWAYGDQEFFTPENLIEVFTLDNINRSAAVFDPQKLLWLNGEHIRTLALDDLTERFVEYAREQDRLPRSILDEPEQRPYLRKMVSCTQERSRTLAEMTDMLAFLFQDELRFEEKDLRKLVKPQVFEPMNELASYAESRAGNPPTTEEWEQHFKQIMERHELKMRVFAQAVRIGTTGTKISPPIFDVLDLLGPQRVADNLRFTIQQAQALHASASS